MNIYYSPNRLFGISNQVGCDGRDERCMKYFGRKKLKGRDHLKDIDIDGRVLQYISSK
jgi:hypothetical protein